MTSGKYNRKLSDSKNDRDLQGVGGGGGSLGVSYSNPALSISVTSFSNDSTLKGSNDFILVADEEEDELEPKSLSRLRKSCTKKVLYKRLPILSWLPKYNAECAIGDLVAGITCGLTVIPQSLAYANIAGLPPQYGLYGSFLGSFIYIFLGSCKDVPMGPTAIASLLTFQAVNNNGPEHAILLSFLSGMTEVLMGIFGLGFIIDFVSGPVSSGFTSAVALIIVTSQIKDVLGIKVTGSTFIDMWKSIGANINETRTWDLAMGLVFIAVLLLMRMLAQVKLGSKKPTKLQSVLNKTFWLIGTSRNAILVIVGGFLGYFLHEHSEDHVIPFNVIGEVPPGLPALQPPPFSHGNLTFFDMVSNLGSGIVVVPLVALLEDIAICKAFGEGSSVDATQELLAIGVSNIGNSFVQAFPITGALSRGAVNNASGAKTPFGGFYTGLLVLLALMFFTPYFRFIPKAALAAIIIAAVIFMVEVKIIKPMWRSKRSDLIPGLTTFIACLVIALEIGILVGIGVNLLFILYHAARPKISVETLLTAKGTEYLMVTPDRCLIFPAADYVRNLVTKRSVRAGIPVVIDCSHIYGADYTAATVIRTLTIDFVNRNQPLLFYNLKPSVCAVFEGLKKDKFAVFYNEEDIDDLLTNVDKLQVGN